MSIYFSVPNYFYDSDIVVMCQVSASQSRIKLCLVILNEELISAHSWTHAN